MLHRRRREDTVADTALPCSLLPVVLRVRWGYGYAPPAGGPIGPPEYASSHVNYNPQGGMMGNQRYEYSSMQGKRKALLIGINYFGQNGELRAASTTCETSKLLEAARLQG